MQVKPDLSCWIGLTDPACVILIQYYFVVGYAHFAFNVLACAGSVGLPYRKVNVNKIFHFRFSSGGVLRWSRDQRSLLLGLSRLPYLIESPFEFSLNVTA